MFVGGEARVVACQSRLCRPASSGRSSWPRSASSLARSSACSRTRTSSRASPRPSASAGRLVRMVGHGSSDNAASYGVYAFGLLPGLTALRDSISLSVYYGAEMDMSGSTRDRALAVRADAGRRRVRRASAARRRVHGRDDERPGLRPRARRRGAAAARGRARARRRRDEDVREPARRAGPARRRTSPAKGRAVADGLRASIEPLDAADPRARAAAARRSRCRSRSSGGCS